MREGRGGEEMREEGWEARDSGKESVDVRK